MERKRPKQLYYKLFWTYTVIVISIVCALTLYFLSESQRNVLESNIRDMERTGKAAADYLRETEQISSYLYKELYRTESELEDLLAYFRLEPEAYQRYCLKRYAAADDLVYHGVYNFVTEAFEAYEELEKVELISYWDFRMTKCYPEKIFFPGKNGKARIYEIQSRKQEEEGKLIYVKEIRNPADMELAGYMVFTFDGRNVFEELEKDSRYARMVLLSENEDVIFQSAKQENWKGILENDRYMVLKEAVNHYNVCMFLDKQKAAQLSWSTFLTIIGVGLLAILLGISCIQYYVRRLTRRVNSILGAMNQVTTGDLQVRLAIENNSDELDMIASKFNDMCEKLELYIQKSYLAEIERKNAQMQALQSQINPHFLYNTLEAIRMKAICNGDREVGKMLYSMVALFRSQIKEADIITLGQELDYCKQYLELFEYRYNGSFQSEVDCRPDLLSTPVIKFILQPIVENYFIHGIDRNRTDNKVCIRAEQNGEKLCLYVQDNGVGMSADEIRQKNEELKANLSDEEGKKSIGIVNVNRRIKAVYGEEYGIFIQAVQPRGLLVIVTIKAKERKEHEKGHVGRG